MLLLPILDAAFNPLIIEAYLSGIYFLLLIQAIWKLFKKRAHGPYIFALILLWMMCTSSFIFDWVRGRNAFVVNSSSPTAILIAFESSSSVASFVLVLIATIISDGILIWRCSILWKSKLILFILITLLLASSVFNVVFIVLPPSGVRMALLSVAISTLLSSATTVFATFMIALKIILVTRDRRSQYHYTKVIEILVQSAALQSIILLLNGIVTAIAFNSQSETVSLLEAYSSTFRRIIVGIAPTLIAFRVADEKPRTEVNSTNRTGPLSHLAFKQSAPNPDRDDGAQSTWISTMHFDTPQKGDRAMSIRSETGSDNSFSRRGSTEKEIRITPPGNSIV